jgi:hypothetical protein
MESTTNTVCLGCLCERNVERELVSDSIPLAGLVLAHVALFSGSLSPKIMATFMPNDPLVLLDKL